MTHLQITATGRRRGIIPVASCRWIPKEYNPDSSTWRPVFVRYGFTLSHAEWRAKRAADAEFSRVVDSTA